MYCTNCGERLIAAAVSCPSCGSEVRQIPKIKEDEVAATALSPNAFEAATAVQQPQAYRPTVNPGGLSDATKKLILVVAAAIVAIFLIIEFSGGGGGGSQSTPEKTFKGFMSAVKKEDAKKMISYMSVSSMGFTDGENTDSIVQMLERGFADGEMDLRDYRITKVETMGDQATIDYVLDYMENGKKQTDEDSVVLAKVDGKWYISGGLGF
ncbi:zinc ribbon domain-containing protein [Cohnella endophytica]|uniref:Zinc ribbon domain-containing protein n=1 Tax=Cohnella endophytica TaxID=2419778 RepID=A0A494XHT2_9BACL|nr:zinc ribbon domain-containing protein [Cohnella endophytica]RKP50088.1 zinc ribbon domain-containing protein [Cohnella endophytica]